MNTLITEALDTEEPEMDVDLTLSPADTETLTPPPVAASPPLPDSPPLTRGRAVDPRTGRMRGDDASFTDTVLDIFKGIGNGVAQSVAETAEAVANVGTAITGAEEVELNASDALGENTTSWGDMARDTTAFLLNFIALGKIGGAMKGVGFAAKALGAGGKVAKYARTAARGAVADFTAIDGMEAGFADLLSGYEGLRHGMESAASKASDRSDFEGRFQHAMEGIVIGGVADASLKALGKVGSFLWSKTKNGVLQRITPEERALLHEEVDAVMREAGDVTTKADAPTSPVAEAGKQEAKKEGLSPANALSRGLLSDAVPPTPRTTEPDEAFKKYLDTLPPDKRAAALAEEKANLAAGARPYAQRVAEEEAARQRLKNIAKDARDPDEIRALLNDDYNMAHRTFTDEDQLRALMDGFAQTAGKALKDMGPEDMKAAISRYLAEYASYGGDISALDGIVQRAIQGGVSVKEVGMHLTALKGMTEALTDRLGTYARKLRTNGSLSVDEYFETYYLTRNLDVVLLAERNLATHTGRALNSWKHQADYGLTEVKKNLSSPPANLTPEQKLRIMKGDGWDISRQNSLLNDILLAGDTAARARVAKTYRKQYSWWQPFLEMRISGMLGSTATQAANLFGNGLKTFWMPLDTMTGSVARIALSPLNGGGQARKEALSTLRQGARTYVYLTHYTLDALKLATKALRTESPILDSRVTKLDGLENSHALSYDYFKGLFLRNKPDGAQLNTAQELIARSMSYLGPVCRLPTRLMIGGDEFFKQLNFRARLAAGYTEEALEQGIRSADIGRYVASRMEKAFDPSGSVRYGLVNKNPNGLESRALEYARAATFSTELPPDSAFGGLQAFLSRHPGFRLVFPFVRTPANILKDFVAHTPALNAVSKNIRDTLRTGTAEEKANILGRWCTGGLLLITAVEMAQSGLLTGTPPTNPKTREALMATGWQPYSLKIGNEYHSYRRLDPVGMFLGVAADMAALMPYVRKDKMDELTVGVLASLTENITNKTYLQGLSEAVNAIMETDRYGLRTGGRFLASSIPLSGTFRDLRKLDDDAMREMRELLDPLWNTLPGFSDDLPPRRDWVTGETMTYSEMGRDKNDPVLDELALLADSVQGAPLETLHGVELSGEQYSRLLELHGTTRIGGKTLHEALQALIESPGYDVERLERGDPPDAERGPRAIALRRIIARYRERAQDELLNEDEELRRLVREHDYQRALSRTGRMTEDNQRELLDALVY